MDKKCKFSVGKNERICVISIRYGMNPSLHIECDGYSSDREECPFWNKI